MAVTLVENPYLQGSTSQKTRGLLKVIILATIAAAAVSARLFSVIRELETIWKNEADMIRF